MVPKIFEENGLTRSGENVNVAEYVAEYIADVGGKFSGRVRRGSGHETGVTVAVKSNLFGGFIVNFLYRKETRRRRSDFRELGFWS